LGLITRFLLCALIVATTSVLAAFAWDQSDANTAQASTPAQPATPADSTAAR